MPGRRRTRSRPGRARSRLPSAVRTPRPNRATTAASPGVPGATASRASRSASIVGTPQLLERGPHVALARWRCRRSAPRGALGAAPLSVPAKPRCDLGQSARRRDPLLDECVPLVALRALPQQLGAAVAAARADVRIEVEHGVARQLHVAPRPAPGRSPARRAARQISWWIDEAVRVVGQRVEQQVEGVAVLAGGRRWRDSASRARQSCGLRAMSRSQQLDEPRRRAGRGVGALAAARTPGRRARGRRASAAPRPRWPPAMSPGRSRTSPRFR